MISKFNTTISRLIVIIILINCSGLIYANIAAEDTLFTMFQDARQMAFNGEKDEARDLCLKILEIDELYLDAKVLFGRTLGWDKHYDSALVVLEEVINTKYGHRDALMAIIDIQTWREEFDEAIRYCDIALSFHPDDPEILAQKVKAARRKKQKVENITYTKDYPADLMQYLDIKFQSARKFAYDGNGSEAREICYEIIKEKPDYYDALVLASRTLGWESEHDSARNVINMVLIEQPTHRDALLARVDIEFWSNNLDLVIEYCDSALIIYPGDEEFIERKNKALEKKNLDESDADSLNQNLPFIGSDSTSLEKKNSVLADYYFDFFNEPHVRRFHMLSLGYARNMDFGKVIGRINFGSIVSGYSNLLENINLQLNLDAYPILSPTSYAYLNYGFSPDSLFPKHRAGLEYFQVLPYKFEISAGLRYMFWEDDLLFYTASISKYLRKFLLSYRIYFSYRANKFSNSSVFGIRRYLKDERDFINFLFITGASPDQPLQLREDYGIFKSNKCVIGFNKVIKKRVISKIYFGYQNEEYFKDKKRNRYDFQIGIEYPF